MTTNNDYGNKIIKALFVIVLCVAATTYYGVRQPQIQAGGGKGWDGVEYHRLYVYMTGETVTEPIDFPFCKRVALPYLAAQLPLSAEKSFLVINILSGLAATFLMYLTLARTYSFLNIISCLLPMIFYLFAPLRFPYYHPFTVDPPALFFYALSAFLYRRNFLGAVASLIISGLFRESGFYFAAMLILYSMAQSRERRTQLVSILMLGIAMALSNLIQGAQCHGSQVLDALGYGLRKAAQLDYWLKVTAALLMTCGAFIVSGYHRGQMERLDSINDEVGASIVMFAFSVFLAVVGGHDSTRYLLIAYPLYAQLFAWSCREAKGWQIALGSICGLVANNAYARIPEPSNYWPKNDIDGFFGLFPDASHIVVSIKMLVFWGICLLLVRHLPSLGAIILRVTNNMKIGNTLETTKWPSFSLRLVWDTVSKVKRG
jgi:hypothetical protein